MKPETLKAYKNIQPSDELINNTLKKIKKQKRQKNILHLVIQCGFSAAACFALAFFIPAIVNVTDIPWTTASAFGGGSSMVLSILLFVMLCAVFVIRFIIKNKEK